MFTNSLDGARPHTMFHWAIRLLASSSARCLLFMLSLNHDHFTAWNIYSLYKFFSEMRYTQ